MSMGLWKYPRNTKENGMKRYEKQLTEALLDSVSAYTDVNYTKNLILESAIKLDDGTVTTINEMLGLGEDCLYTDFVANWADRIVAGEQAAYYKFFDIENIKKRYEKGDRLLTYQFWSTDLSGNPMQVIYKTRLYTDRETGDLLGLTYLTYEKMKDIEIAEKYKEASNRVLLLEDLSVNVPGGYHRCHESEGFPLAFVSDSFLDVVGWTREQLRDELDNKYLNIVAPEDREFFLGHEKKLARDGRVDLAYRIVRRDGTRRWIQDATMKMVKDGETYYQCTLADITDYVDQLNEEKARAEASNLAKSTFLFNASHDIRTPMNAIQGFAHIIEQNVDNPEIVKNAIGKIIQSSDILMTLLNDVLELSRIEQGKDEINEKPLDMQSHAQNLFELFASEMKTAGIHFQMDNDIMHKDVLGDDLKLTRIAMNLLSNAKKFTPYDGLVTFGIREHDYNGETAVYSLSVKDNGIGMSKQFQERAFEQFERESSSTETGIGGSGLGLAIIKKICDLMNGECHIESELGKGTEITVSIPLKVTNQIKEKQTKTEHKMDFSGKRLLLVEDNDFNREIARFALENMGLIVEEAENGSVAVNMILKVEPGYYDLVLMDIQMPIMDGYTATREIRAIEDERISSIPIIAMTANAFQEDKDKCLEMGMNGHIAKPLDMNNLVAILEEEYSKR